MRIIHIADYYQRDLGYQEPNLAREHASAGHDVHVITSDRYYPFPSYQKSVYNVLGDRLVGAGTSKHDGVTVHRLKTLFEYPSSAFIISKGLKKKIRELKPDLVISHDLLTVSGAVSATEKGFSKYQLIYDNHLSYSNTRLIGSLTKIVYLFLWKKFVRNRILERADRIIAIGEDERKFASDLLSIPIQRIDLVHLGANTELFRPDNSMRSVTRKVLGIKQNRIVLAYAGKIVVGKEVYTLARAFCLLKQHISNLTLLLIGNGDTDEVCKINSLLKMYGLESETIHLSTVKNDELPKYLNVADIGIWAGTPSNVIQEAVSCGLPIIIAPNKTTEFLVKQGNGLLLSKNDLLKSLCSSLKILINNSTLRCEMGRKGRMFAEKNLDWSLIAQKFLEF